MITLEEKSIYKLKNEKSLTNIEAKKIIKGTIDFINMCSTAEESLVPSLLIDEGWHIMILHTVDYEKWCMNKFGRIIHHKPNYKNSFNKTSTETIEFMEKNGIKYDQDLWSKSSPCCGSCSYGVGEIK